MFYSNGSNKLKEYKYCFQMYDLFESLTRQWRQPICQPGIFYSRTRKQNIALPSVVLQIDGFL